MNQADSIKIPFTKEAYEKLQTELERLTKLREEVIVRLQAARELGDLSENGAYKYAKFELGNIGRQLRNIHYQLSHGEVVANRNTSGVIDFGCRVTIKNDKQTLAFLLVSEYESDPKQGKLSLTSPIGLAVTGKKSGDLIEVTSPAGKTKYMIVKVE